MNAALDMEKARVAIESMRGYDAISAEEIALDEFSIACLLRDERESAARLCAEIAGSAQGMPMHVQGALAVAAEIRREFGLIP
jgi:hypothetical protein